MPIIGKKKQSKLCTLLLLFIICNTSTTIQLFSMHKKETSSNDREACLFIDNLAELSKLNTYLIKEGGMNNKAQKDITDFEEINNTIIKELTTQVQIESLKPMLPPIFASITAFIDDLEKKSSTETSIALSLPRYYMVLGKLALRTKRIAQES